jgi:hypothetical protein
MVFEMKLTFRRKSHGALQHRAITGFRVTMQRCACDAVSIPAKMSADAHAWGQKTVSRSTLTLYHSPDPRRSTACSTDPKRSGSDRSSNRVSLINTPDAVVSGPSRDFSCPAIAQSNTLCFERSAPRAPWRSGQLYCPPAMAAMHGFALQQTRLWTSLFCGVGCGQGLKPIPTALDRLPALIHSWNE